jgi:hypothetical protein
MIVALLATKAARLNGVDSFSFVITLAVGMSVAALGIAWRWRRERHS